MSRAGDSLLWYAAFGSNLSITRLLCYLRGGRPRGATRDYEGCRDPSPPREHRVIEVEGRVRFAGESRAWRGGTAFFAPGPGERVHARAYLLRQEQFGDLVAQETRHPVGAPLVLADQGSTRHGLSQVYDVVLDLGELDGVRLLTLSSLRDHPANPPSEAYLRTMWEGLSDGFDLDVEERISYLAGLEGMAPGWTADTIRGLL